MFYRVVICIILFTVLFSKAAWGSVIYHIPPQPPTIGSAVTFETFFSIDVEVNEAIFYYRMSGQQSYQEIEMELIGDTWTANILQVPDGEGIEYFFIFDLQDGTSMLLPEREPNQNPFILSITPLPTMESTDFEENQNFLILSPDENDIVYSDAVLFMVSLYNIPEIDIRTINLYLDGLDVTTDALITPDIVTYAPTEVKPGIKMFTLTASTHNGNTIIPLYYTISIMSPKNTTSDWDNFTYSVNGKSEVSTAQVEMEQGEDEKLNIYQTDLSLKAGWPQLQLKSRFKLTSEESQFTQAKNRYSATIESGKFIKIRLGDFTPSLSAYTINGKRVRGFGTEWQYGWLQFQTAHGELERSTHGLYKTDHSYKISNISLGDSGDTTIYELDRLGYSFKNAMSSYRLALNIDGKFIWGTTFMKTKDDIKSVDKMLLDASFTVLNDTSIFILYPDAQLNPGIYTFSQFQDAISENSNFSYQLSDHGWGGKKPQQNLVLGTDFRLSLDEHKFLLEGYWAISFLNKDIWDGTMSLAALDTLMGDPEDGKIYGMVDTTSIPEPTEFEDLMTINMNLVPIVPIDYILYESDPMKAIMNMPSTAYNLKFRSLYFNNIFEVQYSQVGPEFTSLANPYFPKNTREFSISDKIWFFDRHLQSSVNYKFKTNGILETNTNPYNENTYGININYIPGIELPTAMYGHQSIIRTNPKADLDSLISGNDTTIQDLRVDLLTRNHLFTIKVPINREDVSYWVGGTYNSIINKDQLEKERPDTLFLSQASSTQLISVVFGAHYKNELNLSINFSNFIYNNIEMGETQLNGTSISGSYPLFKDKMSLSGTISYLTSSGLSKFNNFGLSLISTIKISNTFRMNLAASFKEHSTTMKISTNYQF